MAVGAGRPFPDHDLFWLISVEVIVPLTTTSSRQLPSVTGWPDLNFFAKQQVHDHAIAARIAQGQAIKLQARSPEPLRRFFSISAREIVSTSAGRMDAQDNSDRRDVTALLIKWRDGDEDVPSQLGPLICEELRRSMRDYFKRDRIDSVSPDALPVREAYLRMVDGGRVTELDRTRFYGIAAHEMRHVLMGHAHGAVKTGNGGLDLAAFDDVLKDFAQTYPRKSEVVELKFFGGLETKEIAELLHVSEKTVLRDWNFAKLWLCRALNNAV